MPVSVGVAASPPASRFYEDDRIRVAIPQGWTAQKVIETSGGIPKPVYFGVVLAKDRYRVYLLTHYGQASGIEGGRFGEISQYVAPWLNTDDPWAWFDALQHVEARITDRLSRVDLYYDSAQLPPPNGKVANTFTRPPPVPIWFGSFFSQETPGVRYGFFLSFPLGQLHASPEDQMVFTATVDAYTTDSLPAKNNPKLNSFLREATKIISGIQYETN